MMPTVVLTIIVHNRVENIKRWVDCLLKCDLSNIIIVVIHNHSTVEDYTNIKLLTTKVNGIYIPRRNEGFDIGALQDVVKGRLIEFPAEWDYILWCTDDVVPMRPSFMQEFLSVADPNKLVCMEISSEVRKHVRTTGMLIPNAMFKQLQFPADPVLTKQQCYDFEHRGGAITILEQAERLGLVVQVANIETSPLWDTGHQSLAARRRYQRRSEEFIKTWNVIRPREVEPPQLTGLVTVICPMYNSFPLIIPSMLMQTHKNWRLILVHDGPNPEPHIATSLAALDSRIQYYVSAVRSGDWGHSIRKSALQNSVLGQYVVITNADNYHVPTYLELLLKGFDGDTVATYCSQMVHNYKAHQTIDCKLERGYVDCAGVMVRADVARSVGWNHLNDHSADWLYFKDIIDKYGEQSFKKVEGCLLVHN